MDGKSAVKGIPGLLLTAEDIATAINTERDDALAELKARNAELEALLKEVTATRDEAIRQNDELITKNNELEDANCNLTKACSEWQTSAQTCADSAKVADKATEELRKENKELKAKAAENADTISRLSANKVALTEENDKLKTERDQRNHDVLEMKKDRDRLLEENEKWKAKYDELNVRYEELDSVNKEQAEKIRKLDKALTDLKQMNDKLRDENTNLTLLLEDKPEKEAARPVHVVTNSGTEYMFRTCTKASFDNYGDFTVLKIYEGENYVAGFLRGDSPENFAAWWTE
jgi:chromosome segregation ATPase